MHSNQGMGRVPTTLNQVVLGLWYSGAALALLLPRACVLKCSLRLCPALPAALYLSSGFAVACCLAAELLLVVRDSSALGAFRQSPGFRP